MSLLPVHIEEVTAVADLHADIPMERLDVADGQAGYETEQSKGAVYRMKELNATAIIFPSGKIVCTGAKSVRDAEEAMRRAIEKVRGFGVEVPKDVETKIEKIVAAFRLSGGIDLQKVASSLEGASYDPSRIPAVVFADRESGCDFLIREDGKIICTGAKSIKDVQASFRRLQERLGKAGVKADLS